MIHCPVGWMNSFVLSLLVLSFSGDPALGSPPEDFGRLKLSIDRAIEAAQSRKTPDLLEYDKWFLEDYLLDLKNLQTHLNKLSAHPKWQNYFVGFEAHLSSLSCKFLFENEDQEILTEMNRLHSEIYGSRDQFNLWAQLKHSSAAFLKALKSDLVSDQYSYRMGELDTVIWAAHELSLDVANLLFHHNSPSCTRPENRAPKRMPELWAFTETHRAPQHKYAVLAAAWNSLPDSKVRLEATKAFHELETLVESLGVDGPSQSLEGFSALVEDRLQSIEEIRWSLSDLTAHISLDRLRLDFVTKVYDSRGRLREILFPLGSKKLEASTELQLFPKILLELMHQVKNFSLLRSHLRLSLEADLERQAFLDFYWGRKVGSPFVGLRPQPIYPPLDSEHCPDLYSEVINSGHFDSHTLKMKRKVFLENLSHLKPVYDQLKILDEDGSVLRSLPIVNTDAEFRRLELVESLKLGFVGQDLKPFQYQGDAGILFSAQLEMSIR